MNRSSLVPFWAVLSIGIVMNSLMNTRSHLPPTSRCLKLLALTIFGSLPVSAAAYYGRTFGTDQIYPSVADRSLFAASHASQWTLAVLFIGSSVSIFTGVMLPLAASIPDSGSRGKGLISGGLIMLGLLSYFFYTNIDRTGLVFVADNLLFSNNWPLGDQVFLASSFVAKVAFALACGAATYRTMWQTHGVRRLLLVCSSGVFLYAFTSAFIFYLYGHIFDVLFDSGFFIKMLSLISLVTALFVILAIIRWGRQAFDAISRQHKASGQSVHFSPSLRVTLLLTAIGFATFVIATSLIYVKYGYIKYRPFVGLETSDSTFLVICC